LQYEDTEPGEEQKLHLLSSGDFYTKDVPETSTRLACLQDDTTIQVHSKINSKLHVHAHVVHARINIAVAIIIDINVLLCSVTIAMNQSMVFMNNLCRKGENYEVQ